MVRRHVSMLCLFCGFLTTRMSHSWEGNGDHRIVLAGDEISEGRRCASHKVLGSLLTVFGRWGERG